MKRSSIQIAIAACGVAIAVVLLGPLLGDLLTDARVPRGPTITDEELRKLNYEFGPGTFTIDSSGAVVRVGVDEVFLQGESAKEFMRLSTGNSRSKPDAVVFGLEGPFERSSVLYRYFHTGHVKTDDWELAIQPDQLMAHINKNTQEDNRTRPPGYSEVIADGWVQRPVIDRQIPIAYWAYRYHTNRGQQFVTAVALKLERQGYSQFQWIGSPDQFRGAKRTLDSAIQAYRLPEGQGYGDFDPGTDKVSKAGLGEIITNLLTGSNSTE